MITRKHDLTDNFLFSNVKHMLSDWKICQKCKQENLMCFLDLNCCSRSLVPSTQYESLILLCQALTSLFYSNGIVKTNTSNPTCLGFKSHQLGTAAVRTSRPWPFWSSSQCFPFCSTANMFCRNPQCGISIVTYYFIFHMYLSVQNKLHLSIIIN